MYVEAYSNNNTLTGFRDEAKHTKTHKFNCLSRQNTSEHIEKSNVVLTTKKYLYKVVIKV